MARRVGQPRRRRLGRRGPLGQARVEIGPLRGLLPRLAPVWGGGRPRVGGTPVEEVDGENSDPTLRGKSPLSRSSVLPRMRYLADLAGRKSRSQRHSPAAPRRCTPQYGVARSPECGITPKKQTAEEPLTATIPSNGVESGGGVPLARRNGLAQRRAPTRLANPVWRVHGGRSPPTTAVPRLATGRGTTVQAPLSQPNEAQPQPKYRSDTARRYWPAAGDVPLKQRDPPRWCISGQV